MLVLIKQMFCSGQVCGAGVSPFSPGFDSPDSLSAVSSLTNINISKSSNHKVANIFKNFTLQ